MRITQSFIKSVRKYFAGEECGHLVKHQWVDGQLIEPSAAMKVGTFFEFCLTGALPKDGKIPQPEFMASGKDYTVAYRKAKADAAYVKDLIAKKGFEIVKAGIPITKGRYEGTIDILARATKDIQVGDILIKEGEMVVIDLKYSGLLEDRWNDMGWMFTDKQKEHHKTQAVQYHFVSDLKFIYCVTDSSHAERDQETKELITPEVKFFHIPVSQFLVEQHLIEGGDLEEKFNLEKEIGFVARPSFSKCMDCPLKENCADKITVPEIEVIDINVD